MYIYEVYSNLNISTDLNGFAVAVLVGCLRRRVGGRVVFVYFMADWSLRIWDISEVSVLF